MTPRHEPRQASRGSTKETSANIRKIATKQTERCSTYFVKLNCEEHLIVRGAIKKSSRPDLILFRIKLK